MENIFLKGVFIVCVPVCPVLLLGLLGETLPVKTLPVPPRTYPRGILTPEP